MIFIRNQDARAGRKASLEAPICHTGRHKKLEINVFGRSGGEDNKLSANAILEKLKKQKIKGIDKMSLHTFSKTLTHLFGNAIHTNLGNMYLVREI